LLEEMGYLRHTHFHDGAARYHSSTEPLHQHLLCVECGAELGLDAALLEPLGQELRRRYGFEADLTHVALVGRCADCQARSATE
jgi:Fur family ferric uptake transcriptional regulator